MQLFESCMTCEECGSTRHLGIQFLNWRRIWTTSTTIINIVPSKIKDEPCIGPTTQVTIQVTIKVITLPIIFHL
jgi:hypothetical protein